MKKLFVLLLALVVAAGAFAQITVAGYDKARVTFVSKDDSPISSATDKNFKENSGNYSDEIRFNLTANDADGKYGFSARFQGTSNTNAADFATKYMFGWAKFLDGMIMVSAGKLNEGSYQFDQNEANSVQGNLDSESAPSFAAVIGGNDVEGSAAVDVVDIRRQAMELTVAPMAGLKASIIYTPDGDVISGSNLMYGAAYSVENLLNLRTALTGNSAGDILGHVSGEFVGVENLSAVAGLKLLSADDTFYGIYSIVGYTMDKLFIEVAGQYNTKTDALDASYYVEGNVEYTEETYSVRAFGQFNDSKVNTDDDGEDVLDFDLGGIGGYLVGAELSLPVGGGEFNVGLNYSDYYKVQLPVYLKIAF